MDGEHSLQCSLRKDVYAAMRTSHCHFVEDYITEAQFFGRRKKEKRATKEDIDKGERRRKRGEKKGRKECSVNVFMSPFHTPLLIARDVQS
jgi:hypothetical protein